MIRSPQTDRAGAANGAAPAVIRPLRPLYWAGAVALLLAIWLAGLNYRPLMSPDEGRYAEIAREMAHSHDYVTPFLNGLRYFEKPPLQYWITAGAFKALGTSDAVARLIPVAYGMATCLLGWLTLRRLRRSPLESREGVAQSALLISASCPWIIINGHFNSLDMGLTFWLSLALAGLVLLIDRTVDDHLVHSTPSRLPAGPAVLLWLGIAGGFMSKGLVAGAIPAVCGVVCVITQRRFDWLRLFVWWPGWLIFLLACVPWLAMIEARNPGFLWFFFVHEQLLRYTSEIHRRVEPWWYFFPLLVAGLGPWLWHVGGALFASFRARSLIQAGERTRARTDPVDVLLLTWALVVFAFFSASGSKLPSYILPMFVPLAWWLARRLATLPSRMVRWYHLLAALTAAAGLCAAFIVIDGTPTEEDGILLLAYRPWLVAAMASIAVGAGLAALSQKRDAVLATATMACGVALACQVLQWGHSVWGERVSARGLAARVLKAEGDRIAQAPFYTVGTYDQTLPFYLARTLTLVDYDDEMAPGLELDSSKKGPTTEALRQSWRTLEPSYAVFNEDTLDAWKDAGAQPCVIARNLRLVVISNRPDAICL